MKHELSHDELTDFLRQQIGLRDGRPLAVLLIGLRRGGRMELINNRISARTLMTYIESTLDRILRDCDRFAHLDGGQTMLVLTSLPSRDVCELAATRILVELRKPYMLQQRALLLHPHIGIALFPDNGVESDQLLVCAEIALHIAATDERGYYICQPHDTEKARVYHSLDEELNKAIHNNELRVNYQPKISFQTSRCISAEALVRWTTPWGEEVNPGMLVGAAESTGLINPMTRWILNTSLRHMANFMRAGVDIGINVNLPPKMLEDRELPQIVQQSLDIWDVPASRLTLEITESSMINNIEQSIAMMSKLRDLGIRLSIDDFGTGYSSLAYLKRLPAQELKIDILFVRHLSESSGDRKLVRTIIDLAHNFELHAVAEGVENQHTFDLLKEMGCDEAQGFLFSHALSEQDFIAWYHRYQANIPDAA